MIHFDAAAPRPRLSCPALVDALDSYGRHGQVRVLGVCDSTNAEARRRLAQGDLAADWLLVAADEQTAGRGRLDRVWQAPAGSGLLWSLAMPVPPATPAALLGWLPLLAGLATVQASVQVGVSARLKWPNDVVVGDPPRKLAGVLVERVAGAAVVGVGLNVDLRPPEYPDPAATSLVVEGARVPISREELLAACVAGLLSRWQRLLTVGEARRSGLLAEYLATCDTIGRLVVVQRLGLADLVGTASDVDDDGHLLVQPATGTRIRVTAGDVRHLRPAAQSPTQSPAQTGRERPQ